jgi:hypothetical protein
MALAVLVPRGLTPWATRSQRRLAMGIGLSALVLWLGGALLFADLYARQGAALDAALRDDLGGIVWFLLAVSAQAAILWAPLLAIWWYVGAQRVERLKGEDIMREGRQ